MLQFTGGGIAPVWANDLINYSR